MCCLPNVFERLDQLQLMGERGLTASNFSRQRRNFRMSAYRRLCLQRKDRMSVVTGQEQMNLNLMLTDLYASRGSYYHCMNSFNTGEQNRCSFLLITGIPQAGLVDFFLRSVLKIGLKNIIFDFPKQVTKHLPVFNEVVKHSAFPGIKKTSGLTKASLNSRRLDFFTPDVGDKRIQRTIRYLFN